MSARHATLSPRRALRRFGFRQTLRGALVVGLLSGLMMGAQGAAYAAAYPSQHDRDMFVASLSSVPAIGFMTGEIRDAATAASYSIYKSIAVTTLLSAVWGLLTTTRLLRGQEETDRLEVLLAGSTSKRSASVQLLTGMSYAFILSFAIAWSCIAALGADPQVGLSPGGAALLTLGVYMPGIVFAALGILTSQLALSRGRALAYGLVPLIILFVLRGAANSITAWDDLKRYTPFGWTDLLNPVLGVSPKWLLPSLACVVAFTITGIILAGRRDLGASLLPESLRVRSRFPLLGSPTALAIRQQSLGFVWWLVGTLAFAGLLAGIAKVGADALASSPAASGVIRALGDTQGDLIIAFLGFGGMLIALILLVMCAVMMGSVRRDEARGYLDNLLVQPVGKYAWLAARTGLIILMTLVVCIASSLLTWKIAKYQGVSLDLGIMLQNAVALCGTVILLLGIGAFVYGLIPRFTQAALFVVIIWSFIVDILRSFLSLDDTIDKTSLLHYVSFVPTKAPDWRTFLWLVAVALVLFTVGMVAFRRRDIVSE